MDWGRQRGFASRSSRCPTSALRGRPPTERPLPHPPPGRRLRRGRRREPRVPRRRAPSDEEVARLLATIYRRVQRLLARRGLDVDDPPRRRPTRRGIARAGRHQHRLDPGADRARAARRRPRAPARPRARRPLGHLARAVPGAPRGLRSAREHHGGGRRPYGSRAPVPLRAAPSGGAGAPRTDARRTRPRHPEERVARRNDPPPLRAGRAPGEARCLDSPPTRQPRAVPRHPGAPCAGTGARRGARRPVTRRTPAHRRGRARPRPIPSGRRRLRHRPRRESGRREGGESSREAATLEVGGLDAAGFRSRRSDRAACASAGPPPSLASRSLPQHPGLTRRLARPRPWCSRTPTMTVPGVAPRILKPRFSCQPVCPPRILRLRRGTSGARSRSFPERPGPGAIYTASGAAREFGKAGYVNFWALVVTTPLKHPYFFRLTCTVWVWESPSGDNHSRASFEPAITGRGNQ